VFDPSGQSEQPAPASSARVVPARRRAVEGSRRALVPAPPEGTPTLEQKKPAPPTLKLDPNPY
jgi:hypothetical protein